MGAATALTLVMGLSAQAAPQVATDITPVHSLVSQVMDGVGEPALVIQRGASPHSYSLRPSEAAALEDAEIVFWIGPALTPWLANGLDNLAGDARQVGLLAASVTDQRMFREDGHDHADAHDHDAHDHEAHEPEGDEAHDHAHDGVDPHAWLDPGNARAWLGLIADTLADADPANAAVYQRNARAAQSRLTELTATIDQQLAPVRDTPYIVFHDAYQYFEARFGLNHAGAIALSDASDPSPARIARVRDAVAEADVRCVFAEPQFNPGLVASVVDGTGADTGVLDPLGSDIPSGASFYPALLRDLADRMMDCLGN
ncbi:zinc ABC transporter substrate-binding protein [Spiribacter pallidus]|uniref:zinc ABC transporter substrate-binding protein n=1 Tax=Spiribacter pallidus TaxID=1987936 RepID=UPI00349F8898